MSHFVVIVIGEDVDGQLAPYDEQVEDEQYLEFVDETEEVTTAWKQYPLDLLADGGSEQEYKTLHEYAVDYYGYNEQDGKYGYMHNHNGHWDWWIIGGRWSGFFPLKEGAEGVLGEAGAFKNEAPTGTADQLKLCDIDIERARKEAEFKARADFAKWEDNFTRNGKPQSWEHFRNQENLSDDECRAQYQRQPAIVEDTGWICPVMAFGFDKNAYVERQTNSALVPFAVVKDGKWHAHGEMGWFGSSTEDMEQDEWNAEFHKMLTDLPPDTLITMVDCHV